MTRFINKFLRLCGVFIICYILIITSVIILNYNHPIDYPAAILDKYERLDSLRSTEKIIICGGSSSAYGINSTVLQETFNKPVVNTGLAMSLGSFYHLNLTKDYLKKGDIVIYIPEYEYYYGNELGDDFLYTTFFYYPKIFKDFTLKQKINMLKKGGKLSIDYYTKQIRKGFDKQNGSYNLQYSRESYSPIGDNLSLLKNTKTKIKEENKTRFDQLKNKEASIEFLSFIKNYMKICKEKGIKFFIAYPPIESSQFDSKFLKEVKTLEDELNVTFIGNPLNYVYPIDYFYDSSYHLNGLGRPIRTAQFIKDFQKEID